MEEPGGGGGGGRGEETRGRGRESRCCVGISYQLFAE